jgi:hypothetical protein
MHHILYMIFNLLINYLLLFPQQHTGLSTNIQDNLLVFLTTEWLASQDSRKVLYDCYFKIKFYNESNG